jgi:hypothetical protein
MRAMYCAVIFACLIVPGLAKTNSVPATVTFAYHFQDAVPDLAFEQLKAEVSDLMEASDIRTEWRDRSEISGSDRFSNLIVVDFRGQCRNGRDEVVTRDGQTLGRTQVMEGEILPFVEIECGQVRSFLKMALSSRPAQLTDDVLGRALARVMAHELYHVLGDTMSHSRSGIAKESLSGADLVSSHITFTPADLARMRQPKEERPRQVRMARIGIAYVQ